jgi:Ca2+-transporting ATPase
MNEAPRDPDSRILSWQRFGNLFSYGLTMAVGTLAVLFYGLQTGSSQHATALAFNTFVLFQVFNAFNARSEKITAFNPQFLANKWFWLALVSVVILQIVVMSWSTAQELFHTTDLTLYDWLIGIAIASTVLIFEEVRKLILRLSHGKV